MPTPLLDETDDHFEVRPSTLAEWLAAQPGATAGVDIPDDRPVVPSGDLMCSPNVADFGKELCGRWFVAGRAGGGATVG